MIFRQLLETDSSTYTYLLGCPETGKAILIDPVLDTVERDLQVLRDLGLELSATLEATSSLPDCKAVRITFTLTNHSDERLYVLTWYTPLEGIFGEIFRVRRDGQAIPYEGPLVMRGDPLPENYVLL